MLINKKGVRTFILDHAEATRHHKFERVSASVYDTLESIVRKACREAVARQPSMGKTIK